MVFGGTPIEVINDQLKKGHVITVSKNQDMKKVYEAIVKTVGNEVIQDFAKQFRENIILQLKTMPVSKKTSTRVRKSGGTLREEIIAGISTIKYSNYGGKYKAEFEVKHDLAVALDGGTGIYGPEKAPITAKNRKYMFIPGEEFYNSRKRGLK